MIKSQNSPALWRVMLTMMRPANIVTAYADILAGFALSGLDFSPGVGKLLLATTGLYGGGIVWNDVCDAAIDAKERPERPIPRGAISRAQAAAFGTVLLLAGIAFAWSASRLAGLVAAGVAASALLYDAKGKHSPWLGPLNMGLCRGLNLLLGASLAPNIGPTQWSAPLISIFYIAGVTALSKNEVSGGERGAARTSVIWLSISLLTSVSLLLADLPKRWWAIPFFVLLLYRLLPPFIRALRTLRPQDVRLAVKAGILSLIILDAGIAAAFAGPIYGAVVLLLYLPSFLLAKWFPVT